MQNARQPPIGGRQIGVVLLPIRGILLTAAVLVGSYLFARSGLRATPSTTPTIPFPVFATPAPTLRGAAAAGLYLSADAPQPIPDNSRKGALSHLSVPDDFVVGSVRLVDLQIAHPDTGDLIVKLLAPDMTVVQVLTQVCPGTRNWAALTLDDQAPTPAGAACADNLNATRRPAQGAELAAFRGAPAQGDWVLGVTDIRAGNTGTLVGWGLQFSAGPTSVPGATPSPTPTLTATPAPPTPTAAATATDTPTGSKAVRTPTPVRRKPTP